MQILGESTENLEDQAERIKAFINWYLTQKDLDYYPNSFRMLMYVGLVGCGFRKVYQDPVTLYPVVLVHLSPSPMLSYHISD